MVRYLRALRDRLRDRRRYEALLGELERINAADVAAMEQSGTPLAVRQQGRP